MCLTTQLCKLIYLAAIGPPPVQSRARPLERVSAPRHVASVRNPGPRLERRRHAFRDGSGQTLYARYGGHSGAAAVLTAPPLLMNRSSPSSRASDTHSSVFTRDWLNFKRSSLSFFFGFSLTVTDSLPMPWIVNSPPTGFANNSSKSS